MGASEKSVVKSEVDWDRVDPHIWKALGKKSAKDIAKELGLTPEEVMVRKGELLEGVDELSIQQSQQKLLVNLQVMADKADLDYDSSPYEFKAGLLNSAIAATKEVLKQLASLSRQTDDKVVALNALRVKELLRLMDRVVQNGARELTDRHGLDYDDVMSVFLTHLEIEAAEMDRL